MFDRFRIFAAYLFAIPLALILGFLAAAPGQMTFMLIGMLLFFLALPLFIKWHHALLIVFWNSAFSAFFLPGEPTFWLFFAGLSFGLAVLSRVMGRKPFLPVPEMTRPLVFFTLVVVATAFYHGGIGIKSLGGSENGGKNYVYLLGAVLGYFALTAGQIPTHKCQRMVSLYFLSGTTYILSNLAYALGPAFFFMYYLVPSTFAIDQAANDFGLTNVDRLQGLTPACTAVLCFLLVLYGIRGLFDWTRPWRFLFLCVTVGAITFAGFRSVLALLLLIFAFQFYFERLLRTRLFLTVMALALVGGASVLLFADKMPLSVQRTFSFLPVNVDAGIRDEAAGSTEWRLQMWSAVWKDAPKYLMIGKGYAFDPTEMYLTQQAIHMGLISSNEESMLAGDYHSGPLSVLIPFGILGVVAFLWMLIAGGRVLYFNYRFGDARLRRINTVLLSYYLSYCVSFFFIFGALTSQLFVFLGTIGLSVSINGGARRKSALTPDFPAVSQPHGYAMELK